jgi:hypothetical protein
MRHHAGVAFHVQHRYGGNDPGPPFDSFDALLDEVDEDPADQEHVGVGVVHESGWCIGVYRGWLVTYENVDMLDVEPRHVILNQDRERVLLLMRAAAAGDLGTLEAQPWLAGYEPPAS